MDDIFDSVALARGLTGLDRVGDSVVDDSAAVGLKIQVVVEMVRMGGVAR